MEQVKEILGDDHHKLDMNELVDKIKDLSPTTTNKLTNHLMDALSLKETTETETLPEKEDTKCICGSTYNKELKNAKERHEKTKKHQNFLKK